MPSEQLKHALNARKQSKTSAKRAKTASSHERRQKHDNPSHSSLETLSNPPMNQPKSSTIGRFTRLSSVYPRLHNRDTFSVFNSFCRSLCSEEQTSKPTQPESRTIGQRKRDFTIAIELLFFVSYPFSTIAQQRSVFSASIPPIDRFPARNDGPTHRTRIQDY